MVRIIVDKDRGGGHAQCAANAPDVFELDDLCSITFSERTIGNSLLEQACRGARVCPERIITIEGDERA